MICTQSQRRKNKGLCFAVKYKLTQHPTPTECFALQSSIRKIKDCIRQFQRSKSPDLQEMADKLAPEKQHSFIHNGQKVFEWDQTLEELNIYINLPENVPKKLFYCKIESKHLEVGIKGNPPYLNHDLSNHVKTDCSFWTLEDDIMHVTLQKRDKGQTWSSPIIGQGQLDPYTTDLEQKRLMLQRFQEENPGFDFSQAQFNGNCPDPRSFMGGIRST
nr:nudC domain-containing protein 2 [Ipomoea batatas]